MINSNYDVCVIGGGAAGMAAAIAAAKQHASVVLIERADQLGGVLPQCIHNGFGLHHFKEEMTGPQYAEKVETEVRSLDVDILLSTLAVKITTDHQVHIMSATEGYQILTVKSVVVAIGCRERTRYQIDIPGKRLAGVMTAGHAQHYVNIEGYHVGKKVVILGSGDIGLIMARRLTLEGAVVVAVAELMPYSNGLKRNIVQCLDDFNIPLLLSHTVTNVLGEKRLEKVILSQVDDHLLPIPGTEKTIEADTLLLSVGLIPESKLLKDVGVQIHPKTNGALVNHHMQTSVPWIYSCGNGLHVHDLVDDVSEEGEIAGYFAASDLSVSKPSAAIAVVNHLPIRYVVPTQIVIDQHGEVDIKFRVGEPMRDVTIIVSQGAKIMKRIRKIAIIPSEMEHVKIAINDLSDALPLELNIER